MKLFWSCFDIQYIANTENLFTLHINFHIMLDFTDFMDFQMCNYKLMFDQRDKLYN